MRVEFEVFRNGSGSFIVGVGIDSIPESKSLAAELNAREEELAEAIRLLCIARKYLPKLDSLPRNTELQVGVDAKQIDKFLATTALSAKGEQPPPLTPAIGGE